MSNLDDRQWARLTELSERVPVVRATNLAFGHYMQRKVVRYLAGLMLPHDETATTAVWEETASTGVNDVAPSATGSRSASARSTGPGRRRCCRYGTPSAPRAPPPPTHW